MLLSLKVPVAVNCCVACFKILGFAGVTFKDVRDVREASAEEDFCEPQPSKQDRTPSNKSLEPNLLADRRCHLPTG